LNEEQTDPYHQTGAFSIHWPGEGTRLKVRFSAKGYEDLGDGRQCPFCSTRILGGEEVNFYTDH